jgi:hypothetical protein
MTTNVTGVSQYVRGLVDSRPFAIFSVKDFGAVGDGVVDDTSAIQATINAVQTIFVAQGDTVNSRVRSSVPIVYFPPGRYRTSATLTITRQIRLMGAGFMSSAILGTANVPIVQVTIGTLLLYAAAQFIDLAICGDTLFTGTKTSQHGIQVNFDVNGGDATLIVARCAIEGCGGHGVYFPDNATTPRIFDSIIQANWLDGINFSGTFATAAQILRNVIRENRRGIYYDGTAAAAATTPYLATGLILGNLFENNTTGTGKAGSTTRPCRAIEANNTRELVIIGNYFEAHLNHVWLGVAAAQPSHYCRILHNFFTGAEKIPGDFPGFNGPAFKPADIMVFSSESIDMLIESNAVAPHT